MVRLEIDARDLKGLDGFLDKWAKETPKKQRAALKESARIVQSKAREFCPQSPTKGQSGAYEGPSSSRWQPGRSPGTLTRSIKMQMGPDFAEVGVFAGPALQYANKIHNRRHKDWEFIGPGSASKGSDVGDKFLDRALDFHARDIERLMAEAGEP